MGAYLSQPKTDKVSTDDIGERLVVGASSMQGWRNSQEDAHNAIIDFDANTSFFAVYDGHGGAEVATYCADRLPEFLKKLDMYQEGKLEEALKHAFLEFDRTLLKTEVVEILKILAGEKNADDSDNMEFEEDEEDLEELHEESHMPLNKLFEKYHGHPAAPGLQNLRNEAGGSSGSGGSKPQSPFLRGRRTAAILAQATNKALMDPDSKPEGSSTSAAAAAALHNDDGPSSSGSSKSLENRTEPVEDSTVSSSSSSSSKAANNISNNINSNPEAEAEAATLNGTVAAASSSAKSAEATVTSSNAAAKESGQNGSVTSSEKSITSSAASSSKANAADVDATVSGSSNAPAAAAVVAKQNGSINSSHEPAKADGGISSTTNKSSAVKANELAGMPTLDDDEEDAEYEWNKISADDSTESDTEDDDDDAEDVDDDECEIDDADDEEADSEEFDEEADEDEDDEEVLIANQQFCANMIEEPGKDSGCTAVVALLHGRDLYVANAGDSRCVVCRNGKAIEMSLDHKPEDEEESARIIKAGGRVTQDGRVNGGLNLSRAIGDHAYKMNADLPLHEQMISARPDIKKLIITPDDEFMVLACDGIWNFMTSDEVVDFVRARLMDKNKRVSEICEELFDHCLAPDTMGDGTGCDNMTAVIVRFQPKLLELPTRLNPKETEDVLLKKETEKKVIATAIVEEAVSAVDDSNPQKKAQKRSAEENSNEAEQDMKTKRLKTDIVDGTSEDNNADERPTNNAEADADSHSMETESPAKAAAASCSTTSSTTTTTTNTTTAEEQQNCDSVASTVQQQPTTAPAAVSTT